MKFILRHSIDLSKLAFCDMEANGLKPTQIWCIHVKARGGDRAGSRSFSVDGNAKNNIAAAVDHMIDLQAAGYILVFQHGFYYDLPVLDRLTARGHELKIDPEHYLDALVLSRCEFPRRKPGHKIEEWAPNLGFTKVEIADEQWDTWDPHMLERCAVDVDIMEAMFDRLIERFGENHEVEGRGVPWGAIRLEHINAAMCAEMSETGFTLDVPYVQGLLDELLSEKEGTEGQLRQIFPILWERKGQPKNYKVAPNKNNPFRGLIEPHPEWYVTPIKQVQFNPGSDDHIAKVLTARGWKPKALTTKGRAKIDDETLAEAARLVPEAEPLIKHRHTLKKISQINSPINAKGFGGGWLQRVSPDNRVRFYLNHCGTNTWRPSCSSPNLQQVDTAPEMRRSFIPQAGWHQVGVDADSIELRCLGHYLEPLDGGSYARAVSMGDKKLGTDNHTMLQKALDLPVRDNAKTVIYGYIYGAQFPKVGSIIRRALIDAGINPEDRFPGMNNSRIGEWAAERIKDRVPGLVELRESVSETAAQTGFLYGLMGHRLFVDASYAALNVLFQSAGATIMKMAGVLAEEYLREEGLQKKKDYQFIIWVHDEYQLEAATLEAAELVRNAVIRATIDAGPELDFRCPLAAEGKIGYSWRETH